MHAYRDQYAQVFNDGQDVTLIAVSADPIQDLASWARDDDFQFLMASDEGTKVAAEYGAVYRMGEVTNRNLFVIGPDGRIVHTATPFREVDPTAYEELDGAIDAALEEARAAGASDEGVR